jgi:hypothetical protein
MTFDLDEVDSRLIMQFGDMRLEYDSEMNDCVDIVFGENDVLSLCEINRQDWDGFLRGKTLYFHPGNSSGSIKFVNNVLITYLCCSRCNGDIKDTHPRDMTNRLDDFLAMIAEISRLSKLPIS